MKTILAVALLAFGIAPVCAQDRAIPPGPRPLDARLVAENDLVAVYRMSVGPHAQTPMHDVTPRVVVWLSDAHFVDRYADGRAVEERRRAGDAEWVPARRHSGENLSNRPMEFIAVVLKAPGTVPHPPQRHGH